MIKVLSIIQLPRECGGSYTTGVARVGEGLYKEQIEGVEVFWYFTNVKQKIANEIDKGAGHYFGYILPPFVMLKNIICHPIDTFNQWKHYKKINSVNPLRFEFYKVNINRVIRRVRPDLIHMHSDGVAPLYFANKSYNIPILMTFHGIMYEPETGVWEQNKNDLLANIKMSDYFTALNKDVKRKALTLGVDEGKLWVVPNGTNSNKFYYSQEKRDLIRRQFGVDENTVVFMTTGAVIDRKGQYDFLMWLEKLGINYQYWIVGKGPDEERIKECIEGNNISDKVKILGYIQSEKLYEYLSAADVYAHVSTTEGQAMAEIEAYATGLPTIVRDMIKNTVIGDSENQEHYFVSSLESVENSNTAAKDWINKVIKKERHSLSGCDWASVATKYGDVYKSIMNKDNNEVYR